jgi:inorganic phosphate transporter, PiT family
MLLLSLLLLLGGIGLAISNGANDNGKPVSTLIGSGAFPARMGVRLATVATLLGSLCAVWWGLELLKVFGGQGLVGAEVIASSTFLPTVAIAAGATVALATWMGLPISTTHALLGGLVGAGLVLGQGQLAWGLVATTLAGPLLVSPVLAFLITFTLAYPMRWLAGAGARCDCVCVGPASLTPPVHTPGAAGAATATTQAEIAVGSLPECLPAGGAVLVSSRARLVRGLHILSAFAVSFARGLNDTPKIAAVLLPLAALGASGALALVAAAMAIGGWFLAQRVTETMSHRITRMDGHEADALAGSLTTAVLVIAASRWGLPVSTTHVMTGAIVGTGASHGEIRWKMLGKIGLAWITTLPLAAGIAVGLAWALG